MSATHPMWEGDQATNGLGMSLEEAGSGTATIAMVVEPRMLNGHGMCHGGFIFTLADSAFAFACNHDGTPRVAAHCSISFLRPVAEGERLVATAERRHEAGRSGIYDISVRSGETVVAEFRGHCRSIGPRG